jgi:fumarate hydratase subunit alpha
MRAIAAQTVIDAVAEAVVDMNYHLGDDMRAALERAAAEESSPLGREALAQILENARIAAEGKFPLCQDTGLAVIFARVGEEVRVDGGLNAAVTEGVRKGNAEGYLRKTVCRPFSRENTGDSTPAVIHVELVPGDGLVLDILSKGGGSENMSRAGVLPPAAGAGGVVEYAVETVRRGAVNACPPVTVGIGIGGDLEAAARLAKRVLCRPLGEPAEDEQLAEIERAVLARVNALGVGPAGLGGRTTALAVHAAAIPCHIASLPVAVVLQCHAHRHKRVEL